MLYENVKCKDENDCVDRCLVKDIWQLRQEMVEFIEATNSFDFIETASTAPTIIVPQTIDDLTASVFDEQETRDLEELGKSYSNERDIITLRKLCEQQQLVPSSNVTGAVQRRLTIRSVDDSTNRVVESQPDDDDYQFEIPSTDGTQQPYTVQVPSTPQHTPIIIKSDDCVSIASIDDCNQQNLSKYFSDLENVRQSTVQKYSK